MSQHKSPADAIAESDVETAIPPSLPETEFTPAPRDQDRVGALERRLAALEELATATAEAIGTEEPRVAAALRKLRAHSRT
ncbi:MAG TPA: hypothetical protein VGR61_11530 [Candidatus Dormibacteraeota bacterium]|nr:hypothetical protein [Candidatus Dormibacteraeota bacterium]